MNKIIKKFYENFSLLLNIIVNFEKLKLTGKIEMISPRTLWLYIRLTTFSLVFYIWIIIVWSKLELGTAQSTQSLEQQPIYLYEFVSFIKPQNILLTKAGTIKVGDLGIAKQLQTRTALAATVIGTPLFTSPEILKQELYNNKVNLKHLKLIL